jgi:hypothetical protein
VLGSLIAEIACVGRRVGNVPSPGVMNDGFANLGEAGSKPVDEHQDEKHAHQAGILAAQRRPGKREGSRRMTHDIMTAVPSRASVRAEAQAPISTRSLARPLAPTALRYPRFASVDFSDVSATVGPAKRNGCSKLM